MWERLRRFSSLPADARGIFLRAAVLLPVISISLKMRGFRATQLTLQNLPISTNAAKRHGKKIKEDDGIRMAVRMVNAAARYGWDRPTCLEKSLALWWLLRQQGTVSSVRIGARKVDGKLEAHAWVECEGVVLNAPREEHRHYATFDAAFPLSSERL